MKKIIITLTVLVMATTATMAQSHTVITPYQIRWGMLNPGRGDQSPKAFDLYGDRTKGTATDSDNGTFLNLPPHFSGFLEDDSLLRAVVIEGNFHYHYHIEGANVPT